MRTLPTIPALALALTVPCAATHAQGPLPLSLQQAADMAAKQSYGVQYGELEAQKADARIGEILSVGLPQVDANAGLNNFLKVPTQVIPNFFGDQPPTIEIQLGIPWTLTGKVQLTQLLFDGSYLVGLQATRALRDKAHLDVEQMQHDARTQAAKAYSAVLAAEEGERLAGEGIPLLEKSAAEARAMLEQGFMESTDVDRLNVQLADARDRQRDLGQQAKVARAYLALVLGLPAGTPLTLTDPLSALLDDPSEQALAAQPLDAERHIEGREAGSAVRLAGLEVRHQKAAFMPSLGGFLYYQQQYNGMHLEPGQGPWYASSLWGVQLNVPIFSSGMRMQRVKQARLAMMEAEVNRTAVRQRLETGHLQQQAVLTAAQDGYATAKASMELAERIFRRSTVKFNEGMGSSFELTQEHAGYLTAQQNYIQRVVGLLQARADMRKALDLY